MPINYIGTELELFSNAQNWKNYYSQFLKPYIYGQVLEVGAGIGETTKILHNNKVIDWLCIEPDIKLSNKIEKLIAQQELPNNCQLLSGTIADLPSISQFDSIVYIDVLEHIEADEQQLLDVCQHLKPKGFLVILVPAHPFLYSPFDQAIGHFRRYNKSMLDKVIPQNLQLIKMQYLDSIGLFASLANRFLLKHNHPTLTQIKLWDNWMVPISRYVDPIIRFHIGKTLIGVWQT